MAFSSITFDDEILRMLLLNNINNSFTIAGGWIKLDQCRLNCRWIFLYSLYFSLFFEKVFHYNLSELSLLCPKVMEYSHMKKSTTLKKTTYTIYVTIHLYRCVVFVSTFMCLCVRKRFWKLIFYFSSETLIDLNGFCHVCSDQIRL